MRDGARAFFRYEAFFTILEHLKLKFSISIPALTGEIFHYSPPLRVIIVNNSYLVNSRINKIYVCKSVW